MQTWEIKGFTLEFFEDTHTYLCDGIIIPSITQILKTKFGNKYDFVKKSKLDEAAEKGTVVHEAIEKYCKTGEESDLIELKNFKFLQKHYGFDVVDSEVPVILFQDEEPIAAGRLDMVIKIEDKIGGADIKRTSTLDKNYLAYQLNMYRIAYRQCYGIEWEFLRGIHLRENVRKFVEIPVNEELVWCFIRRFVEEIDGKKSI